MQNFLEGIGLLTGLSAAGSVIGAAIIWINKIVEGLRCGLRGDMLHIYYNCYESETIRQYEAEHFEKCYSAYKALHGNSFIDEIHAKKSEWTVIT